MAKSLNKLMYDYYENASEGGSVAASGSVDSPAYTSSTGAVDGDMIALLKGLYVQNAQMITLLTAIRDNTTPAG